MVEHRCLRTRVDSCCIVYWYFDGAIDVFKFLAFKFLVLPVAHRATLDAFFPVLTPRVLCRVTISPNFCLHTIHEPTEPWTMRTYEEGGAG